MYFPVPLIIPGTLRLYFFSSYQGQLFLKMLCAVGRQQFHWFPPFHSLLAQCHVTSVYRLKTTNFDQCDEIMKFLDYNQVQTQE